MLHKGVMLIWMWLACCGMACAHPHSFIDMQASLDIQEGQLTGMKMEWEMDEMTSADLLYDAGDAKPGSEVWKKLAAEVMANVLGQHYFTEAYRDGQALKYLNRPTEYRLFRRGHKAVLEFVLPFAHPQPLSGAFSFMTYDPAYYVDMRYPDAKAVTLPADAPQGCQLELSTPQPDNALRTYALSLDKNDAPEEDMELGKQFAQKVTLQCR